MGQGIGLQAWLLAPFAGCTAWAEARGGASQPSLQVALPRELWLATSPTPCQGFRSGGRYAFHLALTVFTASPPDPQTFRAEARGHPTQGDEVSVLFGAYGPRRKNVLVAGMRATAEGISMCAGVTPEPEWGQASVLW